MAHPLLQGVPRMTPLTFVLACLPLLCLPATSAQHPEPVVFHSTDDFPFNYSVPLVYATPFFERKYSTGWFTSPIILNTHVETAQLANMLTQRKKTHYPSYVTAHCVEYPTPIVLFNVLWTPNANNWKWSLVLNVEGAEMQARLDDVMAKGQKPLQMDSYSFAGHGTIYYSAVFVAEEKWAPLTEFDVAFGHPKDASYCCGPSSRWSRLQTQGFKPLSVSITQDPTTGGIYVADVWNDRNVAFWQGSFDQRPGELQSLMAALAPPLVPFYVKSYRVISPQGYPQILYSYIAEGNVSATKFAVTVDISRSGVELLADVLKAPPLFVTSFFSDAEIDPQDPSSGDMYGAVWQLPPSSGLIPKRSSGLRKRMVG